jgi:Protein of unknown function (DUF2934)
MKSQDLSKEEVAMSADRSTPEIIVQSDIVEEKRKSAPTSEEIRQRAFEIHLERGGNHGSDLDDWLLAELELQEKYENNGKAEDGQSDLVVESKRHQGREA